jgi:hypothetical protein
VLQIRNRAGRSIALDLDEITFADFEFYAPPGERPNVVCLAWHQYTTALTRSLWIDDLGALPPYRTDDKALFLCFVANAEIGCHLALNWPIPKNIIDLSSNSAVLPTAAKSRLARASSAPAHISASIPSAPSARTRSGIASCKDRHSPKPRR